MSASFSYRATTDSRNGMTQHILFVAAGLKLAIRASQVKAVHEQLAVQEVAGTANWFLGLGVANGRLLPVTDLSAFAGKPSSSGHILELDPSVAIAAFRVDDIPGLSSAQAVDVTPEDAPMGTVGQHLTLSGKSVKDKTGEHHMLDIDALVQSSAFINIKETNS